MDKKYLILDIILISAIIHAITGAVFISYDPFTTSYMIGRGVVVGAVIAAVVVLVLKLLKK